MVSLIKDIALYSQDEKNMRLKETRPAIRTIDLDGGCDGCVVNPN